MLELASGSLVPRPTTSSSVSARGRSRAARSAAAMRSAAASSSFGSIASSRPKRISMPGLAAAKLLISHGRSFLTWLAANSMPGTARMRSRAARRQRGEPSRIDRPREFEIAGGDIVVRAAAARERRRRPARTRRSPRDRGCHGRTASPPSSAHVRSLSVVDRGGRGRSVRACCSRPRPDPLAAPAARRCALDALFGDMPARVSPRAASGRARSAARSPSSTAASTAERAATRARRVRGVVAVVGAGRRRRPRSAGVIAALCGVVHCRLGDRGAASIAVLLAQRSLFDHVAAVAAALHGGGLAAGRAAVAQIVGRDPESLDEYGVARAAIESLAENFSDGVVAPVFWYLLLGLPGLFAYKTANTLDSMIGHRSPRYLAFGWAAARLDDVLNLVPARLTGAAARASRRCSTAARGSGAALRDHAARWRASTARPMPAGPRRRWPARSASRSPGRGATPSAAGRRAVARRRPRPRDAAATSAGR